MAYYKFIPPGYPIQFKFEVDAAQRSAMEIDNGDLLGGFTGKGIRRLIQFPAYIDSISADFSPSWNTYTENGRAEPKVLLNQFSKSVSVSFKVVAETTTRNTVAIFRDLEALTKYATPHYYVGTNLGYQGKFIKVSIGRIYTNQVMIINSIQYSWNNGEVTWSAGHPEARGEPNKPGLLPMWADVSIDFTWIGTEMPSQETKAFYFATANTPRNTFVRDTAFPGASGEIDDPYFPDQNLRSLLNANNDRGFIFRFQQEPGGRIVEFPAYLDDISTSMNSDWESYPEVARADPQYRISQFTKTISLSFKVVAESGVISGRNTVDCFKDLDDLARMATPYYYGAGYEGSFVIFTVGNIYVKEVGYITSLSYNWDNTSITWDYDSELPILTEVNMSISWVGRGMSQTYYDYFGDTSEQYAQAGPRPKSELIAAPTLPSGLPSSVTSLSSEADQARRSLEVRNAFRSG